MEQGHTLKGVTLDTISRMALSAAITLRSWGVHAWLLTGEPAHGTACTTSAGPRVHATGLWQGVQGLAPAGLAGRRRQARRQSSRPACLLRAPLHGRQRTPKAAEPANMLHTHGSCLACVRPACIQGQHNARRRTSPILPCPRGWAALACSNAHEGTRTCVPGPQRCVNLAGPEAGA